MKKIIGIGNALVDTLATLQNDDMLQTFRLPKGSMTLINDEEQERIQTHFSQLNVQQATGGSASNTMLALANLGLQPGFIGTVGNDATGRFFIDNCIAKGITPYLTKLPQQSGIAYTFISPGGERTFATYLGAAAQMRAEDLTENMFHGYHYLYVEGYLVQNHDLILQAVKIAKSLGLKICLDLASYNIVEANKEFFAHLVKKYVDIVFANEEEARAFTGKEPERALEIFHELCETSIVKIGAQGALLMRNNEKIRVNAMPVSHVIDTTAAGDFYAAGVMYGIMQDYNLRQCAEVGSLLSGHIIQTVGTKLTPTIWDSIRQEIARIYHG